MLELPQKFENDIQGKDTYLVPLLVIDDRVFISTSKVILEENYDPLLKSIGNIKESIDPIKKIFKISSVRISLINILYNDKTLGERLFAPSVMNKKLDIYYKSQSAKNLNDCLKVYTGYIASIDENIDTITISAEDRTELTLNKDLPSRYSPSSGIPEKYRNKPIPIVYGIVDKAPLVYSSQIGTQSNYASVGDDFHINSISTPKAFVDNTYLNIKENPSLWDTARNGISKYSNAGLNQYYIENDTIVFRGDSELQGVDDDGVANISTSPISYNYVEIERYSNAYYKDSIQQNWFVSTIQQSLYNIIVSGVPVLELFYPEEIDLSVYTSSSGAMGDPLETSLSLSQDEEGLLPTTELEGNYFTQQDFGNAHPFIQHQRKWMFGDNTPVIYAPADLEPYLGYTPSEYFETFMSASVINMEIEHLCNSGSILKGLEDNDGEIKEIQHKAGIKWAHQAKVFAFADFSGSTGNDPWDYKRPKLHFVVGDKSRRIIRYGSLTPTNRIESEEPNPISGNTDFTEWYSFGNTNPYNYQLDVDDITFADFSISSYGHGADGAYADQGDYDLYASEGGRNALEYLKFTSLIIHRRAILNDFKSCKLFATVEGRVDDNGGRYTGNELTILSGESNIVIRQDINELTAREANIAKPIKQKGKKRYKSQVSNILSDKNQSGGSGDGSGGGGY